MYSHPLFYNTKIELGKYLKITEYKKGDVLFSEDTYCNFLGVVLDGEIDIKSYTFLEKPFTIYKASARMLFGEIVVFSKFPHFLGTGVATKNSRVILIPKDLLMMLFRLDEAILKNYLELTSDRAYMIQQRNKLLTNKNLRDRIIYYLTSESKIQNSKVVHLTQTKEQIALYLGIPRPSLSRELINMAEDGIINIEGKYITLL
jgi:CRP-like cAMP-binding protein